MTQGTWPENQTVNKKRMAKKILEMRFFQKSKKSQKKSHHPIPKMANSEFPPVFSGFANLDIWNNFEVIKLYDQRWLKSPATLKAEDLSVNLSSFPKYVATQEPRPGWAIDHLFLLASPSAMELH